MHTTAVTSKGPREADFVQTAVVKFGANTLGWQRGLTRRETGTWEDTAYEQIGAFDYSIRLKDNLLFGPITLKPGEALPEPSPAPVQTPASPASQVLSSEVPLKEPSQALPPSKSYPRSSTERIDVKFSFPFEAEPALQKVSQEVAITGKLAGSGWAETLELIPKTQLTKDFAVTFPLEPALLSAIIEARSKGQPADKPVELTVTARVRTVAEGASRPIKEEQNYPLTVTLGAKDITFPEKAEQVKEGTVQKTVMRSNSSASAARTGSLALTGLAGVALSFVVWNYLENRRRRLSELEIEANRLRQKYRDLVLDVRELPRADHRLVVQLSSVEDLVKAAEALLKPILHISEPNRHTYTVLDSGIEYSYVHETDVPPTQPQPTDSTEAKPSA